ncbi:tRNA lysidine(34) synthetase TilS [Myceligenerans salitolerans]|uniref:tRNA(Ile)-lysidine synthase n=1 Tax=Myceligenerans salitolerans TaxID=1230528 RepID=A0ABS3IDD4_9MICO|nr:tRNA lysidine(34) synthetase TilS [Myceligenerans salitolerans]MBO0610998.1 tRNA lysidine(34) synthetase TilS [Myceligenerans salitolerans]
MAQIDPAVRRARSAVRGVLAGLPAGSLVLVACSGGADSLALAAALAYEAPRAGRSVRARAHGVRAGAVVVDHGLQEGSDDVAARAAEQCRGLGLDPVVVRRTAPTERMGVTGGRVPGGPGPEAAARTARYGVLEQVTAETGAEVVLLGHTLDDQAEQVLLGLARGAGARSLAGIPAERGRYRRPFLGLRRTDTEAVCAASGLDHWVDPTNLVPGPGRAGDPGDVGAAPLRSQVRGIVMPVLEDVLGPGVAEALARSASQLRDDADALDALAADLLAEARVRDVGESPPDGTGGALGAGDVVVLDVTVLASVPAAVRRRALRLAAHEVTAAPTTARHVEALDALVVAWGGQGPAHLPGGARVERACGRLFLRRERA